MLIKLDTFEKFPRKTNETRQCIQSVHLPKQILEGKPTSVFGNLVECKTSTGTFLCKALIKSDIAVTKLDDSVRITESLEQSSSNELEVKFTEEIPGVFDEVEVEAFVDCKKFNPKFLKDVNEFNRIINGLLSLYIFPSDAEVGFRKHSNFGIEKVRIRKVEGKGTAFGSTRLATKVTIVKTIPFQSFTTSQLEGLSDAEDILKKSVISGNKRFLLIGPSRCGKTTLVRNLAVILSLPFFEISSNDVIGSLPGDTEKQLSQVFETASKFRTLGTSIILVKNLETLCPRDADQQDVSHVMRISQHLCRLLEDLKGALVIATTTNSEALDQNVRRPGRIDEEIYVKMLDVQGRRNILNQLLRDSDIVEYVTARTNGFSGSDLQLLGRHLQRCEKLTLESADLCLRKVQPSALKGETRVDTSMKKSFATIGGMETLKKAIKHSVLGPLQHPEAFERFNLKPPRGILLYGPPGCAKTTIAQCIATESNMNFLSTSAAEVYSPYVGKAEKFIVKLFNQARLSAPTMIFFDEIDALVGRRLGSASNDVQTRILSAFLTEMDGICGGSGSILVVAATNRPDMIDDALMRPGRFDKLIHVPAPDRAERRNILELLSTKFPLDQDVNLDDIAEQTECFSGADLVNLLNEAALTAATESLDAEKISLRHFLREIRPSLTAEQIQRYKNFEQLHKMMT